MMLSYPIFSNPFASEIRIWFTLSLFFSIHCLQSRSFDHPTAFSAITQ